MWMKLLIVSFSIAVCTVECNNWALIVAGSNGWYNYRHQADVCHAYQILHKNGIPDENIVVMMYDDIAYNEQNPTRGIIINKPNGEDVYHGVLKDYTGEDVTPQNFLNILKGDRQAMSGIGSGKVIDSGPDDHVFVYFTDHGAPGLIAFPSSELMASDLIDAINYMYENKKYKRMVVYIEACESGSMFNDKLKANIDVFGTTAANPFESSYACYYDAKRQTYLGDVYSVKWMENSDKVALTKESLLQQFEIVKKETNTSHVMKYGDMDFEDEELDDYQGDGNGRGSGVSPQELKSEPITDAVPAPDVQLAILKNRLRDAQSQRQKTAIIKEIKMLFTTIGENEIEHQLINPLTPRVEPWVMDEIKLKVEHIAEQCVSSKEQKLRVLGSNAVPQDFECYKKAVKMFLKNCIIHGENEHALRHVYVLSNLCEEKIPTKQILSAIESQCVDVHF